MVQPKRKTLSEISLRGFQVPIAGVENSNLLQCYEINPTTSEEEIRPLHEIALSHLARKCFIGNLYKQVKDPNLVGVLSGHKEGSKAFSRYREIDEQMKKDLVGMLE